MRRTLLVALSLPLACATLAAQAATAQAPAAAADTARGPGAPTLLLGYTRVPAPFPVDLPAAPALPALSAWSAGPGGLRADAAWSGAARLQAPPWPPPLPRFTLPRPVTPVPRSALASGVRNQPVTGTPDTARAEAMRPAPVDSNVVNLLPDGMQDFADIGMRVRGRGDLGGAWIRYRPCEPGLRLNCDPGLFPRLQPDMQFGVQVGGTISNRVHIDVDWDQRREFDATNNINVYYQGLQGELLQRVEVGDVSIRLPQSRYLTRGIPAGNFGFKATGRLGGMDVEAVWAQQKGDVATREFQLDAGGGGQTGLVQDASLVLDDADYVRGQFFFVVDPASVVGAPHIDALTMRATDAPAAVRPHPGALAVYRDEGTAVGNFQQQAQPGYFLADAVNGGLNHSGLFRLLQPGADYVVHPSGLWIMLRVPLRPDEALAVAYVTESGDTVGTPGAEQLPPGQTPSLFLIRGPETSNQPNAPTWPYEMHQVYRLDTSSGVDLSSVNLTISLGQASAGLTFRQVGGRRVPYLRLFGLDEDPPADRVDASQILRPSDFGQFTSNSFRGTFVLFPTLQPFGSPPPVPSEGLTADQNAALLGQDANTDIYDVLDPVERRSSARFRLNFQYRVRTEGLASTFNLGALGIRDGSERITLDGQALKRGVDYIIDYDLGTVTLLNPQATLGAAPQGQIRATWEQKSLFQVAPTTVFGLSSRYGVGSIGEIEFTGMYQSEKTLMTRPQLGMEPGAIMLGGMSSQLNFGASWLDALLGVLPLHSRDSSRVVIHSELATSRPNPNTRGATYLDDFESTDELSLSLEQHAWRLGSMPQDATGAGTVLPWPLGLLNAAPLVWQDRYLQAGREVGFLQPEQIDRQINVAGARLAERALYLTVGDPSVITSEPRWRSIVTSLSTTGLDLSRSEYLEFYAGPVENSGDDVTLVFDIGTVGEDAFYYDPSGNLSGVNGQGNPWGQGVLDEEARLARREIWGPEADARGLWDQDCEADPINPVPLGDRSANCTRKNGRPDTEDLNGNGVLDATDGAYYRYVVPLKQLSGYMIRDQSETGTPFRLYRIPLRGGGATAVNGASAATWRFIRDIRLTVVTREPGRASIALARVRVTGSRWAKRNVDGLLAGQTGSQDGTGAGTTSFQVGPVSRLTNGADYASPAGVIDQVPDPSQAIGASAVEYNEKGLRLSYDQLQPDERAEVYFRYPQQPRSFLKYGQLRLWGLAYRGDWGTGGTQYLMVKLGTDASNYYLYRTRLSAALGGGHVTPQDWLPELVIQFDEWYTLRARAERMLANRDSAATGPLVVWSRDSTYAVALEDRARAPNLAAVREISFAVYNGSGGPSTGEVWLDDLRLGGAVHTPALAGRLDMNVNAGGFLSASLQVGSEGGRFQQLNEDASYLHTTDFGLVTTAQLGKLAPESWGIEAPVTVSYSRTGADPIFLPGTDVKAADLPRLRTTRATQRHVGIALRRTTPAANPWLGAIVDGLSLRASYGSVATDQIATAENVRTFDGGVSYDEQPLDVSMDVVPSFVTRFLRWLAPGPVERSDFFARLTGAELRLTPERISAVHGVPALRGPDLPLRRHPDRRLRRAGGPAGVAGPGVGEPRVGAPAPVRVGDGQRGLHQCPRPARPRAVHAADAPAAGADGRAHPVRRHERRLGTEPHGHHGPGHTPPHRPVAAPQPGLHRPVRPPALARVPAAAPGRLGHHRPAATHLPLRAPHHRRLRPGAGRLLPRAAGRRQHRRRFPEHPQRHRRTAASRGAYLGQWAGLQLRPADRPAGPGLPVRPGQHRRLPRHPGRLRRHDHPARRLPGPVRPAAVRRRIRQRRLQPPQQHADGRPVRPEPAGTAHVAGYRAAMGGHRPAGSAAAVHPVGLRHRRLHPRPPGQHDRHRHGAGETERPAEHRAAPVAPALWQRPVRLLQLHPRQRRRQRSHRRHPAVRRHALHRRRRPLHRAGRSARPLPAAHRPYPPLRLPGRAPVPPARRLPGRRGLHPLRRRPQPAPRHHHRLLLLPAQRGTPAQLQRPPQLRRHPRRQLPVPAVGVRAVRFLGGHVQWREPALRRSVAGVMCGQSVVTGRIPGLSCWCSDGRLWGWRVNVQW